MREKIMFIKYSSIENSYREKFIEYVKSHESFPDMKWQVTEKIHGANFSFIVEAKDPDTVKIAKRTSIIEEGEEFYGCRAVLEKYEDKVLDLTKGLFMEFPGSIENSAESVQIYGELYGPGIQSGVYYGEEKDFAAYDIRVNFKDDLSIYLDTELVVDICFDYGIPHVPVIGDNYNFDEAMSLEVEGVYSAWYPRLPDNQIEGYVIKPMFPMFLGNGSRVIIKNKAKKFLEKKSKAPKPQAELSKEMQDVLNSMLEYLNENRLKNVLSKIGEVTQKDFGKLLGMLQKDLLEDWYKDNEEKEDLELTKEDMKAVTKQLNNQTKLFIRERFLNIIDGVY